KAFPVVCPAGPGVPFMDGKNPPQLSRVGMALHRAGITRVQAGLVCAATLACLGAGAFMLGIVDFPFRNGYAQNHISTEGDQGALEKLNLFQGWTKPDVAIVLSGEQHGYLQPCGCSKPQYGGLARRYNLFQMLRQRGWPVVAFDLGDIPAAKRAQSGQFMLDQGPQTLLKYRYAMLALHEMNYGAVTIGQLEMHLPLFDAMGEIINDPKP